MSHNVNKYMVDLINQVMRSPNPNDMINEVMEMLKDTYITTPQVGQKHLGGTQGKPKHDMKGLPYVPDELLNEIASKLDNTRDVANMRLVNKRFARATTGAFVQSLAQGRTIYPRYDSVARFLAFLVHFPALKFHILDLTLVAEGMKVHEYGYSWAWENLQDWEDVGFTSADIKIIKDASYAHAYDTYTTSYFIQSGGYRTMLGLILAQCPNLRTVNVRKLKIGEHLSGWILPGTLEKLSFYRPDLDLRSIFYGDWKYDTVNFRVTQYKDEFGDVVTEAGAGPQARFSNDLYAALTTTGRMDEIKTVIEKI